LDKINSKVNNRGPAYISVITCTNRLDYMDNIFANFNRQKYKWKQLIIILNNNLMDIHKWENEAKSFENIKVYQLDESITLGECLNFGVMQSDYEYIAKFDDDDFYNAIYLSDSLKAFKYAEAGVIGKSASFVYFEKDCILALRNPSRQNRYVKHLDGPTMIIKREVFNYVKFRDITRGEDKNFCLDCIKQGINLFSINKYNHVYIRHALAEQHTWPIENKKLLNQCKIIAKDVTDFNKYITKKPKDHIKNWYQIFKSKVVSLKKLTIKVAERINHLWQ
jgi:hypothetical protein